MASTEYKLRRKGGETQMADSSTATCYIARLPECMIVEIFLKLAVATLMQCRRVCKWWRSILSSPSFNQSRLAEGSSSLVIFRSGELFYFLEGDESSPAAVSTHEKGLHASVLRLVNSCNGLVCMTSGSFNSHTCAHPLGYCHGKTVFVVNPVTSEYITLPSCPKGTIMELCCLGFCTKTNQFKAFRILSKSGWCARLFNADLSDCKVEKQQVYVSDDELDEKLKGLGVRLDEELKDSAVHSDGKVNLVGDSDEWTENLDEEDNSDRDDSEENFDSDDNGDEDDYLHSVVEVYTLGTGTWRRIDVDSHSLGELFQGYYEYHSFSYVNGSLYWIIEVHGRFKVASFNFESERFQRVTDGNFVSDHVFGLGTYKNCLYLCRYENNESLEVGSSDSDDENHEVEDDRGVELFLLKESWSRENVVKFPKDFRINQWADRVIKCFENGDVLFCKRPYLYLFNKAKQDFKRFSDCKIRSEDDAIVHVPSFLSLKDVIKGESSKVLNLGSKKSPEPI